MTRKKVNRLIILNLRISLILPVIIVCIFGALEPAYGADNSLIDTDNEIIISLPPMNTPRYFHMATELENGDILITGGVDAVGNTLASAELYTPTDRQFIVLPSMNDLRKLHTATLLDDGRVLIVGGGLQSAEIYDPTKKDFTTVNPPKKNRQGHTATLLPDGRVFIAGGGSKRTELFSLKKGRFLNGPLLNVPRKRHSAILLPNSREVLIVGGFNGLNPGVGVADSAALFDPVTDTISSLIPMINGRAITAVVALPDDRVYVIAGRRAGTSIPQVEVFEPVSQSFRSAGAISQERGLHRAELLPSGKILVVGGTNPGGTTLTSIEVYDPDTESASFYPENLEPARALHTLTLLQDGTYLLAGGFQGGNSLDETEFFNPLTNTTSPGPKMIEPRSLHTVNTFDNGLISFSVGRNGEDLGGTPLHSIEYFSPIDERFIESCTLNTPRRDHASVALQDGRLLILGGRGLGKPINKAEVCDLLSASTEELSPMFNKRSLFTATRLDNGQVLVVGGRGRAPIDNVELFIPDENQFQHAQKLQTPRKRHTATLLDDGRVLVVGGRHARFPSSTLDSAEIFDPQTGQWIFTEPMTEPRQQHTATRLSDGRVLIIGGRFGPNSLDTAEIFDPGTSTFSPVPSNLHVGRQRHTSTLLNDGRILIAGGRTVGPSGGPTSIADLEIFDPETLNFTELVKMINSRSSHTATLLPNGLVLIAGGDSGIRP